MRFVLALGLLSGCAATRAESLRAQYRQHEQEALACRTDRSACGSYAGVRWRSDANEVQRATGCEPHPFACEREVEGFGFGALERWELNVDDGLRDVKLRFPSNPPFADVVRAMERELGPAAWRSDTEEQFKSRIEEAERRQLIAVLIGAPFGLSGGGGDARAERIEHDLTPRQQCAAWLQKGTRVMVCRTGEETVAVFSDRSAATR